MPRRREGRDTAARAAGRRARERMRQAEPARRSCRCRWPWPNRRYFGVPVCTYCQQPIEREPAPVTPAAIAAPDTGSRRAS